MKNTKKTLNTHKNVELNKHEQVKTFEQKNML